MIVNKKKWKQKFAYRDSTRWLKHHPPRYSALHGEARDKCQVMAVLENYQADEAEFRAGEHRRSVQVGRNGMEAVLEPPRSRRWRGLLAVREARTITVHHFHKGHTALKMLGLMYWPRPGAQRMTLAQAAQAVGLKPGQAKRLYEGFLRLVEERYHE